MEATVADQLLTCTTCGTEFAWTVGQQRMAWESQETLEPPTLCPLCQVKRERMGRVTDGVPHLNGRTRARPTGYRSDALTATDRTPFAPHAAHPTNGTNGKGRVPQPDGEPELSISPNRPPTYRSGEAHPLAGHDGEAYMGTVKWFNDRKGFGFITLDNGEELFVHYSGIVGEGYRSLEQEQRVRLNVEDTPKGPQASHVEILDALPDPEALLLVTPVLP